MWRVYKYCFYGLWLTYIRFVTLCSELPYNPCSPLIISTWSTLNTYFSHLDPVPTRNLARNSKIMPTHSKNDTNWVKLSIKSRMKWITLYPNLNHAFECKNRACISSALIKKGDEFAYLARLIHFIITMIYQSGV